MIRWGKVESVDWVWRVFASEGLLMLGKAHCPLTSREGKLGNNNTNTCLRVIV